MEVDTCSDEADHCTYMFCSIIQEQEDSSVPQSDVITATVGFDGLGAICAADSQLLMPSHHPYASFDESYTVHEDNDNALAHTDSHSVVVQGVVEEEVSVNARVDIDDNAQYYEIFGSDSGKIDNSSETNKSYIECAQNVVVSCCYECGRKFTKLRILKGHVKRQHGTMCDMSRVIEEILPVATVCRQCGYVGTTQQATQIHVIQKHHLPVARSSRQCKTNAQRLKLNRQRMAAQKAAYPPIVCLICRSEISLLKNYDGHIKRYHQNDSKFAKALNDVRRIQFERTRSGDGIILTCETCGELHDENKLIAHIKWKHGNDVNVKQLIITARQLIRSSKQQHMASTRCVVVSCPHCGRRLRQISLANHIKFYCNAVESASSAVSSARCFVECTVCGQLMPRPKLFRHRRLVHHIGAYKQIETFMCEYCPREFTEAHQLRTHVQKHTGELIIICLLCYRNFMLNYVYQEHLRHVHCAKFRFSCSDCGRGFWKETTLRQHVCLTDEKECNVRKLTMLKDKMQQLKALNKPLFTVVSPYKSDAATDDDDDDDDNNDENDSYVWICLLCKLPFKNRKSYEIHQQSKHTRRPDHSYKHSCAHCGRRFTITQQFQLHKCRPENYASNVQKEMRLLNRHHSPSVTTVEYIGPTFVRVQRHDDILAIVGDIFSHADNEDNVALDNTCTGDS